MHETVRWLDRISRPLGEHGFVVRGVHPLPRHVWLTHWAEPLAARLRAYERSHDLETLDTHTAEAVATHRSAVAAIFADPDATSCAFWVAQRVESA
jgi:hypothetical protein